MKESHAARKVSNYQKDNFLSIIAQESKKTSKTHI